MPLARGCGNVSPMSETPRKVLCSGAVLMIVAAVGVAPSGCATVSASQRGYLAQPEMDPATAADEEAFHAHIEAAREAGMGGHGAQGGGCGCG